VIGHNLLDGVDHADLGPARPLWTILHARGVLEPVADHKVLVSYPILPWIGVICLGYGFGAVVDRPMDERRRLMLRIGLATTAAFVVLRAINVYGDPSPWSSQPRGAAFTVLSFLNCAKYPPSLLFVLMTLGPAIVALFALDGVANSPWLAPVAVFGRVPLFFYVAHLFLLRYTSAPISFMRFGASAFRPPPGHAGSAEFPLYSAYVVWICALLLLYPLCHWFARLKARRTDWWLTYL
jgi:uncharacterized membrane protein